MIIQKSRLNLTKLRQIPEKERALFVLLGHVVNEVNVLNKTFYLCTQFQDEPKWRSHAHTSQALVFARLLIGKLYEGWNLLRKGYFESQISKIYDEKLHPEASKAPDDLKKYFGRENLIETIRNNFSFHYSLPDALIGLGQAITEEELLIYLAENNGNTLYYFSEIVINAALLEAVVEGDPKKALERLMDESAKVVNWFNELASGIMVHVIETYLLETDKNLVLEPVDLGSVPVAEQIEIPYFFTSTLSKSRPL
ncbi:MAG TPA: hypothetical protein VMH34_01240 [Gammaproteobacteria bacterium]|nr:hypothetical protein [Gammaproteobacteria bacterium]